MLMHAVAWLINDLFGISSAIWFGFAIEALLLLLMAAGAGWFAYKNVMKGSPPVPAMAIEEAKETKATLSSDPTTTVPVKPTITKDKDAVR
jgi:hypothetical protein